MTPEPDDLVERMRRARLAVLDRKATVRAASAALHEAEKIYGKLEAEWLNPKPMPLFEKHEEMRMPGLVAPPGQPPATVGHGLGVRGLSRPRAAGGGAR